MVAVVEPVGLKALIIHRNVAYDEVRMTIWKYSCRFNQQFQRKTFTAETQELRKIDSTN